VVSGRRAAAPEPAFSVHSRVGYRHGKNGAQQETMDYLEFVARLTSHIPDKGQVMVRYYGLSANGPPVDYFL
jgi:hypothetical protein